MGRDLCSHRQATTSSFFSSGCMTSSTTCFPLHEEMEYSRLQHLCSGGGGSAAGVRHVSRRNRRWRSFLWRLVRDSSKIGLSPCGSFVNNSHKPISYRYDAVSYSQNFDEGCHVYEEPRRRSLAIYRDVR